MIDYAPKDAAVIFRLADTEEQDCLPVVQIIGWRRSLGYRWDDEKKDISHIQNFSD